MSLEPATFEIIMLLCASFIWIAVFVFVFFKGLLALFDVFTHFGFTFYVFGSRLYRVTQYFPKTRYTFKSEFYGKSVTQARSGVSL